MLTQSDSKFANTELSNNLFFSRSYVSNYANRHQRFYQQLVFLVCNKNLLFQNDYLPSTVTSDMIEAVEERLKSPPECDQEDELTQDLFSNVST